MNEKIEWVYPIKGITESYSTTSDFFVRTKCRVVKEQELKIVLPGNPLVNEKDEYTMEMVHIPMELESGIRKWLTITPQKNKLTSPDDYLLFVAKFAPLKPFKTQIELLVNKSSGGRWKFKLNIEASTPDVDDTIYITSPLNRTASVSFRLSNIYKLPAEFTA
mmetsp:Transcript_41492/g.36868  ORF Transcript_41492/g.36868 Transcript_41492/m.36868 type:complete len:163 (+) Transcript_41492:79-567(+)